MGVVVVVCVVSVRGGLFVIFVIVFYVCVVRIVSYLGLVYVSVVIWKGSRVRLIEFLLECDVCVVMVFCF